MWDEVCVCMCVWRSSLKTGEYVSLLMCWNSSQVRSEGFGKEREGRERQPELKWQISKGQSDAGEYEQNTSGYFNRLNFSYTLFSKFLWSKTASSALAHHSSGSFLRAANSIVMQGDCAILIFSSVSKPPVLVLLPYVSDLYLKWLWKLGSEVLEEGDHISCWH